MKVDESWLWLGGLSKRPDVQLKGLSVYEFEIQYLGPIHGGHFGARIPEMSKNLLKDVTAQPLHQGSEKL
jgi:hypothetical protein